MLALNVMFQVGLGFSPLACGVATLAIPMAAIGGSITSSAQLPRIGRATMHIGIVTMAAGLLLAVTVMHATGATLTAWDLAGPLTAPPPSDPSSPWDPPGLHPRVETGASRGRDPPPGSTRGPICAGAGAATMTP